ncbi:Heme/hemopexin-binding protein precursor [Haemophilus influenzae]|nr:Heme/hemopexin-binding protein precursor [Haemophilus influenzae]
MSELTRGCDHSTEKGSEKPVRTKVRHLALKPLSAMLLSLGVTSIPQSVLASGLQGMDVVHGTATMQVDGNKTIIRNSVDAIINWKQFNINQNEMVQFLQESNNSAVFNRVTSDQISQLKGILDSNGQVFLINPNGITIGKDAIINTNGFTASTLDISNENIKARNFTLEQTKDKALAEIVNHGLITVGKDGSVNLIGGKVKNEGVISVNGGSISLLAGQKITISDIINPTITYSIAAPENEAVNLGDIFAKGGNINVRAANIRNQGKLSADSVSKDKSGNIILSAKEGEAEIGGVISAQNQQAKGGKLMITGDKVTLKTGAVIDLSGKEGGETYLGGDERGEGKNGIQLAKKTSLEKGSTINVSGKEKGGRAIVWGDIALIDGNINAQGSGDIAKTGGFVETSGHDLFIKDNAIVDAKEWLLDPDIVSINEAQAGRSDGDDLENNEYISEANDNGAVERKRNGNTPTLTNSTLEKILARGSFVNITATRNIYVNSSINLSNGSLTLWSNSNKGGIKINKDITVKGDGTSGNLTIRSGGWLDIHSNISVGEHGTINISSADTFAIENKSNMITFSGGGNITIGPGKKLRLENVSFKNSTPLNITVLRNANDQGDNNFSANFNGTLNVSGTVNINRVVDSRNVSIYKKGGWLEWRVSQMNVGPNSHFNLNSNTNGSAAPAFPRQGLGGIKILTDTTFNVAKSSNVNFTFYYPIVQTTKAYHSEIKGNLTVSGGGKVRMKFSARDNGYYTVGIKIASQTINVTDNSTLDIEGDMPAKRLFEISDDLTINATGSTVSIKEVEGTDTKLEYGLYAEGNITTTGGSITLGSNKALTKIKKNIVINKDTNLTLASANFGNHRGALTVEGNITTKGNLTANGDAIEIKGNLDVAQSAKFNGNTKNNLNITGNFTNNGTAEINITQGAVNLGNVTNDGNLNITTRAKNSQKSIIRGDITNNKGNLNITNNGSDTEIQIGGNISQKEGNLTISSDKVNIINQITIKAGVNGEGSSSSATNNANLTIKTKELKLAQDLNISGFNKAEITAKNGSDLTIGETNSGGANTNTKKVTFNNVKNSEISANGHNVTLNSKVETSNGDSGIENGSNDNNVGLTVTAKNVTVNNNITSQNVTVAAKENLVTAENAVINATSGTVNISTKTGDIRGEISGNTVSVSATDSLTTQSGSKIEAKSGEANVTSATGTIGGTISGNTVSVKATNDLITKANSKIEAKSGEANVTSATGTIDGTVSGKTVNVTASTGSLTVGGNAKINATEGAATLTATSGKLTTKASSSITSANNQVNLSAKDGSIGGNINAANVTLNTTGTLTTVVGSSINANEGTLVINAQDATLNGDASGDRTEVNAVNASGSGNVTAATSSSVNITGDLNTINGLNIISKDGRNTVRLRGKEIDVKYIQPGVASVEEVIEAKRVLEKVKDLSDEERETLAKLGVSAVRFVEPNNAITVNTQNEFTTRPSSQVTISEGKACFSSGNGAAVCTNVADDGQQ